jgi:hypothetical protein
MKITKKEDCKCDVVTHYVCDNCGVKQPYKISDITEITIRFGYGSIHDGTVWVVDLCDNCIDTIFKNMDKKAYLSEVL